MATQTYMTLFRSERCRGVLSKESWLDLRPARVPLEEFRTYRGLCPPWIWADLRARGLITAPPAAGKAPAGKAPAGKAPAGKAGGLKAAGMKAVAARRGSFLDRLRNR